MRTVLGWLAAFPLVACMQVSTGTDVGSGGGGGGGAATGAAPGSDAGPTGTNCAQVPQTQVTLCEQISLCPGVALDPGAFPDCGFRLHAQSVIDLECVCSGGTSLCAIGVPDTCDQATKLLMGQSSLLVCQQASNGSCVPLDGTDAGSAAPSIAGCDTQCRTDCAGAPSCIQLCGC